MNEGSMKMSLQPLPMQMAILLLTGGSTILLGGWLFLTLTEALWYSAVPAILAFTYPALLLHLLAWLRLGAATRRVHIQRYVLLASIVSFVAGLLVLPWVSPAWFFPFERSWSSNTVGVLFSGIFSFVPSVFAPVVIAHSILFIAQTKRYVNRTTVFVTLAGAAFLATVAISSVIIQATLFGSEGLPSWFLGLAGLTSLGYALVWLGLWKERRNAASVSEVTAASEMG